MMYTLALTVQPCKQWKIDSSRKYPLYLVSQTKIYYLSILCPLPFSVGLPCKSQPPHVQCTGGVKLAWAPLTLHNIYHIPCPPVQNSMVCIYENELAYIIVIVRPTQNEGQTGKKGTMLRVFNP